MIGRKHRVFKLDPWLVRALIPRGRPGTYLLYRMGRPVYAGRSDLDLQHRLITHARAGRGDYFGFNTYPDPARAFDMECALFHALKPITSNVIHPASPGHSGRKCFICGHL